MKHQHTLQPKHDVMYPDLSYPMIPEALYHHYSPYYSTSFIDDDDNDFFQRQQQQMKQKQESVHVIDIDNQGKKKKT